MKLILLLAGILRADGVPIPYRAAWTAWAGGTGIDHVSAIAVDSAGAVYLAGYTESSDMFAKPVLARSGGVDAFVVKLDPSQNNVVWATYLGGAGHDQATSLAVHPLGGVVIGGFTQSGAFPVKSAHQNALRGGTDAFVVRLDANGNLVFGTYLGGAGADKAFGIAVTPAGDIWTVGETDSADFPLKQAMAGVAHGGLEAFAARLNAAGVLQSSMTFGGSALEGARGVAADSTGDAYITGTTDSANFPTFLPFQPSNGGGSDAFVVRLAADGSAFRYSSYLGGPAREVSMPESGTVIAVDQNGMAWIAGIASSLAFPLVAPLQSLYGGGNTDTFFARVTPAGSLAFSTYFGGNGSDEAAGIAIVPDGSVAFGGSTTSTDLPLRGNVGTSSVYSWDGFAVRVAPSGSALAFSTYLSGAASDSVTAVAARGTSLWMAGNSASPSLLPSGGLRGLIDGYVLELRELPPPVSVTINAPQDKSWDVTGDGCEPGSYAGVRTLAWTFGNACAVTMHPNTGTGTREILTSWSDGATDNPRIFVAAGGSWTPVYRTEHLVQTSATSGGTASPVSAWISAGSAVQLTATPAPGYSFAGWSGGFTGNPATGTVNAPVNVTATFVCAVAVDQTVITAGSAASTHRIAVTSPCAWSAITSAAWIVITKTDDGELAASISANDGAGRSGTITIGANTIQVIQAAACRVIPKNLTFNAPAMGAYVTIGFTAAPSGCSWAASSSANWAQVYPIAGTGDGSVSVNVFAHFGLTPRNASVTLGSTTISISQSGSTGTTNERFAGLMYYNFLGRLGSPAEIAFHASTLAGGMQRKDFVFNFFNAEEFNRGGRFIAGLYVGLLNRDAEFGGWLFQRGAYVGGIVDQARLVANFLDTPEYALTFGKPTNQEFVRLLYRYILRREASQAEVDFQAGQIGRITRVQLAMNFLNSREFREGMGPRLTAFLLYACILLRDGSRAERDALASKVAAGEDIRHSADWLLATAEFDKLLR